jgi:DNA-binding NarL/FixJ family response regulator
MHTDTSITKVGKDARVKVMVVDDHVLVKEGVKSILEHEDWIEVVGSSESGEEAIELAHTCAPDVILMDVMMGGMTGIEATRWIKEQNPFIKVILLTSEIKKETISAGIQAGIDGYLPKTSHKSILLEAVLVVAEGKQYFTEAITSLVFEDFYQSQRTGTHRDVQPKGLSRREQQVLEHLARGLSIREAAEVLLITAKTVETHRANILAKLGLKNTTEMILYAVKNKIVELE